MTGVDFDLERLAEYLHVSPQQAERLANRGQIPARRVAGQWRFSRADVHHWMEERMGLVDDAELQVIENRLLHQATERQLALHEMLLPTAIAVPLPARTRNSVVTQMCQLAANTGHLWDAAKMADAVRQREELHSTALEIGAAFLHPRRPLSGILSGPLLALGIASRGIPFGGKLLTDVFFLICSIDDRGHLVTLARLSRLVAAEGFLDALRAAPDAAAAHAVVVAFDQALAEYSA